MWHKPLYKHKKYLVEKNDLFLHCIDKTTIKNNQIVPGSNLKRSKMDCLAHKCACGSSEKDVQKAFIVSTEEVVISTHTRTKKKRKSPKHSRNWKYENDGWP